CSSPDPTWANWQRDSFLHYRMIRRCTSPSVLSARQSCHTICTSTPHLYKHDALTPANEEYGAPSNTTLSTPLSRSTQPSLSTPRSLCWPRQRFTKQACMKWRKSRMLTSYLLPCSDPNGRRYCSA